MLARPPAVRLLLPCLAAVAMAVCVTGVALAVPGDLVELEVLGVIPLESDSASILVLRQKGARTVLPIFIGRSEGIEIDGRMKSRPSGPGHSADLLQKSIEALGGKISRIVIEGTGGNPFHARVALDQGRNHHDLEARPSDSVALALASRAPIFATRTLMAESGLNEQELARAHGPAKGNTPDEHAGSEGRVEKF